jgi:hypothetical protein
MRKEENENSQKNYDIIKDYDKIMKGFDINNPLLNQKWEKEGDYYKQLSIYDNSFTYRAVTFKK